MLRPKRTCSHYGCTALVNSGACSAHRTPRPSARTQGYTHRWDQYSKAFLAKHPFCCDPFGRHRGQLVQATVTGHRLAHKGNQQLMWNHANHYPLCTACNAYQCVTEEGGFGNPKAVGKSSISEAKVVNHNLGVG